MLSALGKKETAINAIVEFYRTNDISIALEFEELISRTKLSREDLDNVLRQLNDEGYLQDILWASDVASTFYLSNFGKRKLGIEY